MSTTFNQWVSGKGPTILTRVGLIECVSITVAEDNAWAVAGNTPTSCRLRFRWDVRGAGINDLRITGAETVDVPVGSVHELDVALRYPSVYVDVNPPREQVQPLTVSVAFPYEDRTVTVTLGPRTYQGGSFNGPYIRTIDFTAYAPGVGTWLGPTTYLYFTIEGYDQLIAIPAANPVPSSGVPDYNISGKLEIPPEFGFGLENYQTARDPWGARKITSFYAEVYTHDPRTYGSEPPRQRVAIPAAWGDPFRQSLVFPLHGVMYKPSIAPNNVTNPTITPRPTRLAAQAGPARGHFLGRRD